VTPGWVSLYVPGAAAVHHEQLSTDAIPERRIVEARAQPRSVHAQAPLPAAARAVRWLTAWSYAVRALVAVVLPGHSPRRYWRHVIATLAPGQRAGSARGGRGVQPR